MSILIILIVLISSIFTSKSFFKKWFNPISLYALIWGIMLVLFEMKLIAFYEIRSNTWLIIATSFLSFIFGTITILSARSRMGKNSYIFNKILISSNLFNENGKVLKFSIYFLGIIGLASALQHWQILLNTYGSLVNIIAHSYTIYRSRLTGDEPAGIIPYFWMASYIATFLAGIYTAFKRKINLPAVISIVGIILKELAKLTRSGILLGLLTFLISFILTRHLLNMDLKNRFKIKKKSLIISVTVLISLMIGGASLIKVIRNPDEQFKGTNQSLSVLKGGALISPAIYFYAASQVGVLNQYLEKNTENNQFGSSTFLIPYNFLSKFGLVERPPVHSRGHFIPNWSNTATYLRDLHSDFGYFGLLVIPYLIGLLVTFYWFKFYETQKFFYLVILSHLHILIGISFFTLATKFPPWVYGILFLSVILPKLETYIERNIRN